MASTVAAIDCDLPNISQIGFLLSTARETPSISMSRNEPINILDDQDVDSILASIPPPPAVIILSLEGDTYETRVGDIVQVLSSSGGFQGTLAYVRAFTDTGRISVCMPSNQQIRSYKAKNIRFVCREEDGFGANFHQQHNTCRWQRMAPDQEDGEDPESEASRSDFHGDTVDLCNTALQSNNSLQGVNSGARAVASKEHWIDAPIGAVCIVM